MAVYKNEYQNIIKIDGAAEIEKLRSALEAERDESDRLRSSLEEARGNVTRLYQELDSLKEASGVDILEQKIAKFEETASRATDEFKVFLQSVNLKSAQDWSEDDQFSRFYRRIKDGSLTSQEAILQVKTRFRELMEENYSSNGGLFDSQQVQSFTATLNRLSETVDAVVTKLQQIETEGVKTGGAIGGGGTGNILEVLKQIEEMSDRLSESGKGSIDTIQKLVQSISEYGSLDSAKLIGVSQAFKNIADIGEGSYSKAAVENIVYLTKQLAAINSQGSTSFRFDLTGLKDLKVSKAALSNLAEFLPKIPETGVSALKKLSEIDFSNLQNLKVSKASVENLSKLADAERMGQVLEQIQQISKMMTASTSQSGAAVTGEASKVDSSTAAYEKHAAAVEAAVQAENQKKTASEGVSQGLTEETYNTDQATESARAHANALRSVIDTLTNVNARMYALRNNGGEGTDEYAALERIRDRLEKLRENANSFSAKHITDAMAGIRLAFSEAKLDIGLFDNTAKDSAKSEAEAFSHARDVVKQYFAALKELDKNPLAQQSITRDSNGTYISSTSQYEKLAAVLNQTAAQFGEVTKASELEKLSEKDRLSLLEEIAAAEQKRALASEASAGKTAAKDAAKDTAETYRELLTLYKELSSLQVKKLGLSPTENINELAEVEAGIQRINNEISTLKGSDAWGRASSEMTDGLVSAMLDGENKVAMAKAKILDDVNGLATGLQQGKEKIRFDDLVSKFSALESASVPLSNAMRQLKDAQQVLTSGSATDSEKIDAYRQYADAIRTVTELIGQESAAQQRKIAQDNQLKQLTEEISAAEEKYAKGFSQASKDRNAAYNQLTSDVEKLKGEWDKLSPEEREARLRSLIDAWKELNQASGQTNLTGVNNGLGYLQSRIERMLSLGAILMSTFNKMKQMIKDSIEIDTAMTQLRIVTNSTASEYAEYGSTIAKTSKEIGASITDMIDSTTTFARLGYTLPDASELARVSAMISNVGAIDVSATQSALTAITKAFGINADEIESVMDKLVVVGNNFPVSVAELAEGMNNAGSALAAAGNSFEQSIALLTAANTTVKMCRAA